MGVEEKGAQGGFEKRVQGAATSDAVDESGAAVSDDAENEWCKGPDHRETPAEATVVCHEPCTRDVQQDGDNSDEDPKGAIPPAVVAKDIAHVGDVDEQEEAVQIQQPCRDLKSLRLHSVEPTLRVQR